MNNFVKTKKNCCMQKCIEFHSFCWTLLLLVTLNLIHVGWMAAKVEQSMLQKKKNWISLYVHLHQMTSRITWWHKVNTKRQRKCKNMNEWGYVIEKQLVRERGIGTEEREKKEGRGGIEIFFYNIKEKLRVFYVQN